MSIKRGFYAKTWLAMRSVFLFHEALTATRVMLFYFRLYVNLFVCKHYLSSAE